MKNPLLEIPKAFHNGTPSGIASVCSAHPVVIESALMLAKETGRTALIEATCNQVNQDGGYTGMTPIKFRAFVEEIAVRVGLASDRIILGGDHLGPNPWKELPAEDAMAKAEEMIAAFAAAGFSKLHLDTSMGCANEPVALDDAVTANRAARLAAIAEAHKTSMDPVYVIGTEVPVPGGALEEPGELAITRPEAVSETYETHRLAFAGTGVTAAFERVIALVVQPGVEFGHSDVVHFDCEKAQALSQTLSSMPGIVFEAHSTDYQTEDELSALVQSGFVILKVGPWLTFALRKALYGLDAVADVLEGYAPRGTLMTAMDDVMLAKPQHWQKYYEGGETDQWLQRHFSLSDRIRYYWPTPEAESAVAQLRDRLSGKRIPGPILDQFLGSVPGGCCADQLVAEAVQSVLRLYERACAAR